MKKDFFSDMWPTEDWLNEKARPYIDSGIYNNNFKVWFGSMPLDIFIEEDFKNLYKGIFISKSNKWNVVGFWRYYSNKDAEEWEHREEIIAPDMSPMCRCLLENIK